MAIATAELVLDWASGSHWFRSIVPPQHRLMDRDDDGIMRLMVSELLIEWCFKWELTRDLTAELIDPEPFNYDDWPVPNE